MRSPRSAPGSSPCSLQPEKTLWAIKTQHSQAFLKKRCPWQKRKNKQKLDQCLQSVVVVLHLVVTSSRSDEDNLSIYLLTKAPIKKRSVCQWSFVCEFLGPRITPARDL